MRKTINIYLFSFLVLSFIISCSWAHNYNSEPQETLYKTAKPYTRWWWFASMIKKNDIKYQLDWLKANGFGGVEVAFIYPVDRNPNAERLKWWLMPSTMPIALD